MEIPMQVALLGLSIVRAIVAQTQDLCLLWHVIK